MNEMLFMLRLGFDANAKMVFNACPSQKGIVSILQVEPGTEPDPWEIWKDYAEAALNALLGE